MEFKILDLSSVTEQELIECLEQNIKTAQMRRREIAELSTVATMEGNSILDTEPVDENCHLSQPTIVFCSRDNELEDEVAYYYEDLQKLGRKDLEEKILEVLPSKSNPNYQKLMQRLKAEVLKEIKELKVFALTENLDAEEIEELRVEILTQQRKIDIMDILLSAKDEVEKEESSEEIEENNFIFVPTGYGTIRVLEEISRIPEEYYGDFRKLFCSIKNGTFKGIKRFASDSSLAGLTEVKAYQTRVVFDRLDKNSYAIITAFVKKSDNDLGYRTTLENAYVNYQRIKKDLQANLENPEFRELNGQYEEELFRRISPVKEVPMTKRKDVPNG